MHKILTVSLLCALILTGCSSDDGTAPFFSLTSPDFKKSFFPLEFRGHQLYVGNDKAFINAQSYVVKCDGKLLQKLGGFLYLTTKNRVLIVSPTTKKPKAMVKNQDVFIYEGQWRERRLTKENSIGVNTMLLTSRISQQDQCSTSFR